PADFENAPGNHAITKSVLNRRSQELWRKTGRREWSWASQVQWQSTALLGHGHNSWCFSWPRCKGETVSQGPAGGWGGIRTHDTLLTYTRSPGVRLRPLGHPSLRERQDCRGG